MDNQRSEKIMEEYREEVSDLRRQSYPKMSLNEAVKIASEYMLNHYSKEELKEAIINDKQMQLFGMEKSWLNALGKAKKMAKGSTVKGGGVGKFKVGDKVIIEYINDGNEHNGEIGTITYLNEYNYYPKGDKSVVERKTQGEITYHNGEVEEVSDFYREGSGLVSPIQKVILRKAKEYVNTDLMEKLKKEWQEKNKYAKGSTVEGGDKGLTDDEVITMIENNLDETYEDEEDYFNRAYDLGLKYDKSKKLWFGKVKYAKGSTVKGGENWYTTIKPNEKLYVKYDFARSSEQAKNMLRDLAEGSPIAHKSTSEGGLYNLYVKRGSIFWREKGGNAKGSTVKGGGVGDTIRDRYARLTKTEAKRLDELSKKVRINEQTDAEDIEWDKLVHKYRGWEYKHAKGSTIKGFKKGDKVKTREGNIETVIRVNSNGNIETQENDYTHNPQTLELIPKHAKGSTVKGNYFSELEANFSSTRRGGVKNYSVDIDLENGEQLRGGDLDFKDGNDALFLYERVKQKGEYQHEKIEDIQLIVNFKNGDYETVDIPTYANGGGVDENKITEQSFNKYKNEFDFYTDDEGDVIRITSNDKELLDKIEKDYSDRISHREYNEWIEVYKNISYSNGGGELYRLYDVQDDNFKEIIGSLSQINDFLDEQGENGNYDKWIEGATFSNADKYGLYLEKIGKYAKGGIMSSGFNYSIGGL